MKGADADEMSPVDDARSIVDIFIRVTFAFEHMIRRVASNTPFPAAKRWFFRHSTLWDARPITYIMTFRCLGHAPRSAKGPLSVPACRSG